MKNEEKILRVTYKKKIRNYNYERIIVDLKNSKNIIALSKENEIFIISTRTCWPMILCFIFIKEQNLTLLSVS